MTSRQWLSVNLVAWIVGSGASGSFAQSPAADSAVGGPYRVIAADFTGDRVLDLAIAYHAIGVVTVEAGDGKGGFLRAGLIDTSVPAPSVVRGVYNVAHGDVDNDGLLDLAFTLHGTPPDEWRTKEIPLDVLKTGWHGRAVVARNLGGGKFEIAAEYAVEGQAAGVRLADLDQDGRLDLLYTARGSGYKGDLASGRLYARRGLGRSTFSPALEFEAGPSAYYVETADLNNDRFLDVVVPNEHGATVQYWINPGKTLFENPKLLVRRTLEATPITGQRTHAINDVRAADLNGDGKLDLVTANLGTSTISIFSGNGDGTFQSDTLLEAGENGAFLAVGDLNGDGARDFAITHWTADYLSVFLNQGNGRFAPRRDHKTGMGNYGLTLADLDGDGKLDAVTANYRERSLSVLRGIGDGTFQPAVTTPKGLKRRDGKWMDEIVAP